MLSLPVESAHHPHSPQTAAKTSRLRGATVTEGVCPYARRLRAAHLHQGREAHRHRG